MKKIKKKNQWRSTSVIKPRVIEFEFMSGYVIYMRVIKPVIYIFCCSVSVGNQFTFPNISFAINCNNPARFLYVQGQVVWQQPVRHMEILSHHYGVWLQEETEKTETD